MLLYNHLSGVAGWSSLVARRAHNPKVVSSNLAPATIHAIKSLSIFSFYFYFKYLLTFSFYYEFRFLSLIFLCTNLLVFCDKLGPKLCINCAFNLNLPKSCIEVETLV